MTITNYYEGDMVHYFLLNVSKDTSCLIPNHTPKMWRIITPSIPKYDDSQCYSFMTDNIPKSAHRKKGSAAQVLFEENDSE